MRYGEWTLERTLHGIRRILTEELSELAPELAGWVDEYIDQWGRKAARSPIDYKRINWTLHWSRPENLERLKDDFAEMLRQRGYHELEEIGRREVQYLTIWLTTVMQKDVGYGSRRAMEKARKLGFDPEEVLHPDYDGEDFPPDVPPRKAPHKTATWTKYRAEKELSRYPVYDPDGNMVQPTAVPHFRPQGFKPRRLRDQPHHWDYEDAEWRVGEDPNGSWRAALGLRDPSVLVPFSSRGGTGSPS